MRKREILAIAVECARDPLSRIKGIQFGANLNGLVYYSKALGEYVTLQAKPGLEADLARLIHERYGINPEF
jgi:hypothetical protein